MWNDVLDLHDFYSSPLGGMARRMLLPKLRILCGNLKEQNVLGLGFVTPYLKFFKEEGRFLAAMPAQQGVVHWPDNEPNLSFLTFEEEIPLPDLSMDKIIIIHGLECAHDPRLMLRECWRILKDSGKLILVVPNRLGIWARMDKTPFGNGHPYSLGQIRKILRDNFFAPTAVKGGLFAPPNLSAMVLSQSLGVEAALSRWAQPLCGVWLIEVGKQLHIPAMVGRKSYALVPRSLRKMAASNSR